MTYGFLRHGVTTSKWQFVFDGSFVVPGILKTKKLILIYVNCIGNVE